MVSRQTPLNESIKVRGIAVHVMHICLKEKSVLHAAVSSEFTVTTTLLYASSARLKTYHALDVIRQNTLQARLQNQAQYVIHAQSIIDH